MHSSSFSLPPTPAASAPASAFASTSSSSLSSTPVSSSTSTPSSAPPLSLEQTEHALLTLISSCSSVLSCLSVIKAEDVAAAQEPAEEFLNTLQQVKQALAYHIAHLPSERTYHQSSYLDYAMLDLQQQKTINIRQRLQHIQQVMQRDIDTQEQPKREQHEEKENNRGTAQIQTQVHYDNTWRLDEIV